MRAINLEELKGDVKFVTREQSEQAYEDVKVEPLKVHFGALNMEIRKAVGIKSRKAYIGVFSQSGKYLGFAKPEFRISEDGTADKKSILGFELTLKKLGAVKGTGNTVTCNGMKFTLQETTSIKTGGKYIGVYDEAGERRGIANITGGGQVLLSLNMYAKNRFLCI